MATSHNPGLSSSEIAVLWSTYQTDTMIRCILKHFLAVCQDDTVKPIQKAALQITEHAIQKATDIFQQEKLPVPLGFTDQDWDANAKKLYPDVYTLRYLKHMTQIGMMASAAAKSICARQDMRDFFTVSLNKASYLFDLTTNLLLKKGLFVRPPMIAPPEKVEFVQEETFFSQLFGQHRPLTAIEISHMGMNTETNLIGLFLLLGFAQTAKHKEIQEYAFEGVQLAKKYIEHLSSMLLDEYVIQPSSWIGDLSESKDPPFSDKLMTFQITSLCSAGFSNYAASIAASHRTDLAVLYGRFMTETGQYSLKGAKLMIKHEWMEQPPQNKDRKTLIR